MKADVGVGGRPYKGDRRTVCNWVGKFHVNATKEGDQFILAAMYRALFGTPDEATELRAAIKAEAERCYQDHKKLEQPAAQAKA